jgi:probable F420-dependent oxidoreductase
MHYGIHLFATKQSIQPGDLGKYSEERGFESVWFSEHTHIPVNFLNSGEGDPALPDYYWQTYDPFIALTLASAVTKTIKLGTGICLVVEHDTLALAKAVATLDQISSGRFIFGIGAGWLAEEMRNHGVDYRSRYLLLQEQVSAMKKIWSEEEAEFQGNHINFSKLRAFPKPAQTPHPPIIAGGGAGPKSLDFIANHCDGWMPILGYPEWPGIKAGIADLHQRTSAIGRNPDSIELTIFCWSPPDTQTIEEMAECGIKKIILSLEAKTQDEALPLLDEYAKLISG